MCCSPPLICNRTPLTVFAAKTRMHLMHTLDSEGRRIYTLKKVLNGAVTKSAHPARFSPDDKYSRFELSS